MARTRNFRRRPNNTGSVIKLSGKRRKTYTAKITSGYNPLNGNPIQKYIGYYETWEEANDALSLYRLSQKNIINDSDLKALSPENYQKHIEERNKSIPTFKEIYNIVYEEDLSKLSDSRKAGFRSWIKHLKPLHDLKINQISLETIQDNFDAIKLDATSKVHIKVLVSKIFEYATIHKYINRDDDLTEFIKIGKLIDSNKHYPFSNNEIKALMNDNSPMSKIILVYIFTGVRANELLRIDRSNIYITDDVSYLIASSKTKAGKNRVVPIHDCIKPFVIELLLCKNKRIVDMCYQMFSERFKKHIFKLLNVEHTMHDTRTTFITLCNEHGVDIFSRKRIVGHKMNDITFDVYTATVIETLFKKVNYIKIE